MTYNFDPDLWYENQLALLERRRDRGELDQAGFDEAWERLDEELQRMLDRLDNTYQLPRTDEEPKR